MQSVHALDWRYAWTRYSSCVGMRATEKLCSGVFHRVPVVPLQKSDCAKSARTANRCSLRHAVSTCKCLRYPVSMIHRTWLRMLTTFSCLFDEQARQVVNCLLAENRVPRDHLWDEYG